METGEGVDRLGKGCACPLDGRRIAFVTSPVLPSGTGNVPLRKEVEGEDSHRRIGLWTSPVPTWVQFRAFRRRGTLSDQGGGPADVPLRAYPSHPATAGPLEISGPTAMSRRPGSSEADRCQRPNRAGVSSPKYFEREINEDV